MRSATGPATGVADAAPVRSAARGSALNLVGAATAAVVGFATVGLITNVYGQSGAGLFFTATALFTLAANATRLGGESALTLFVARSRVSDRHGVLEPLVKTASTATTLASALLAAIGLLAAPWLADRLTTEPALSRDLTIMIRILAVALPSFALSQVLFGASRGYGTMRPSVVAGQLFRPLAQFALVAVVIAAWSDTWPLALAWAVASMATAVGIGAWVLTRLRRSGRHDGHVAHASFDARAYWRFAAPRAVTDLVSSALERLDVLLVAMLLSAADAGLYGASSRLLLAGQLLLLATSQSMAPLLSAAFVQRRHDDAESMLRTLTTWSVLLLWPPLITLAFGAETVLSLFGDGFTAATPVVRVLALALAVIVALGPGDIVLLMTGESVASLINHVVALAVLVIVSVVLLPQVGLIGAAWAWALSRVLLRASAGARVWQTTGVHTFGRGVGASSFAAFLSFVPTGFVVHALLDAGPIALLTHITVGGLVYLVATFVVRRDLELEQLLSVLRRRSRPVPGDHP